MLRNYFSAALLLLLISSLSAQSTPLDQLQQHLKDHHERWGLSSEDITNYQISSQYQSQHSGVYHIYLQQAWEGIPVQQAILNANLSSDGKILSIGNRFEADLAGRVNATSAVVSPLDALSTGLTYFSNGLAPAEVQIELLENKKDQFFRYSAEGVALEPLEVYLQYLPTEGGSIHLCWTVDYYQRDAQHAWRIFVDAQSGDILQFFDRVIHCEFEHCTDEEDPLAVAHLNSAAHRHQHQHLSSDTPNSYHAFPLYVESPIHGISELINDPANPLASPFGWHDTNGIVGPEFTITRGNNVHAYHDIFSLNRSIGGEPDGGDSLCFNFPYVDSLRPHQQIDAATVNLFVWNNFCHDVFHFYGFDEAAGNFQAHNFIAPDSMSNDYVRAEALDGSGTNNANFFTPRDGRRPRMQMFVWEANLPTEQHFVLSVTSPDSLAGNYSYRPTPFGELLLPGDELTAEVVSVLDSVDVLTDACDSLENAAELVGKAALIDQSGCGLDSKAFAVQEAGAVLAVICISDLNLALSNNGQPVTFADSISIPVIGMSREDCDSLLMGTPGVTIQLPVDIVLPDPGPGGEDSDFDNLIIVHEYGHGVSNRLTGGPQLSDCLRNDEQAGEGWSDWLGLVMTTTSANNADEPRGIGTYVSREPTNGPGIRPFPYSRDMDVNPITYGDFNTVSRPHGIGSIFASAMWDLYWNLVDIYGFDDDIYNGSGGNNMAIQLVMDGMKLQPCSPNFLESRDAIILADSILYEGAHECLIWSTFARRGFGVDAQPGGIESFDSPFTCFPVLQVEKTAVTDTLAGSDITYELEIRNGKRDTIFDAVVTDILPAGTSLVPGSSDCAITVTDGVLTINLGDTPGEAIIYCSYQLSTDPDEFSIIDSEEDTRTFGDWDRENPLSDADWRFRSSFDFTQSRAFFARNEDFTTDQLLIMEDPITLTGSHPGLVIFHAYETQEGVDGGVIEITTNNGDSWEDVGASRILENSYDQPLSDTTDNPLGGRPAFHGRNFDLIRSAIDLSDFAGQEIKIRFRFGTDSLNAGDGWWIDQINFMEELSVVVNRACATTEEVTICSEAGTLLFADPTSTEEILQNRELAIFPNPTNGELTVRLPQPLQEAVDLRILSIDGRQIRQYNYSSFYRERLQLGGLTPGVYLLQFRTSAGLSTRRIILR